MFFLWFCFQASVTVYLVLASGWLLLPWPCLGLRVTASASALPPSSSALPRPWGDCHCLSLASIFVCLASASGWMPRYRLVPSFHCLGLGSASAVEPWPASAPAIASKSALAPSLKTAELVSQKLQNLSRMKILIEISCYFICYKGSVGFSSFYTKYISGVFSNIFHQQTRVVLLTELCRLCFRNSLWVSVNTMGCGASRSSAIEVFTDPMYVDVYRQWDMAWKTVETRKVGGMEKKLIVKRRGWKTVRIFVSSTFRDFHQERECLVKKVVVVYVYFL